MNITIHENRKLIGTWTDAELALPQTPELAAALATLQAGADEVDVYGDARLVLRKVGTDPMPELARPTWIGPPTPVEGGGATREFIRPGAGYPQTALVFVVAEGFGSMVFGAMLDDAFTSQGAAWEGIERVILARK